MGVANDDGSPSAQNPALTPTGIVPAVVGGSLGSVADEGSVYLEFEHLIDGEGTVYEGEDYPNFFHTSWIDGFVRLER